MQRNRSTLLVVSLLVVALAGAACKVAPQVESASTTSGRPETLSLAYSIASGIPANPHGRDRAKMQALVVQTCIDLGMLEVATGYAKAISDWRRGETLALIGQQYAAKGENEKAKALAESAMLVAAGETDWRRERIAVEASKIALQLGNDAQAVAQTSGVSPAELAILEVARTAQVDSAKIDAQADIFDRAIATKNFDLARGAIDGYLVILSRVGKSDDARCTRAIKSLEGAIPGLPLDLQVSYSVKFAKCLFAIGQETAAAAQVKHAAKVFAATEFLPEDIAPLGVEIVRASMTLGDRDAAQAELKVLLTQFEARQSKIVDLRRARSWRSLAEAFEELGDRKSALSCYDAALEAGALNPNARPRAEDLCATCVSMARAGITPTPALRARIDATRVALVDPW